MQKIFSSMTAAIGRQLKQSVKVFHSLMLYRRLPTNKALRWPRTAHARNSTTPGATRARVHSS